ncbi:MAG: hypothetical protein H0X38_09900 [Planctomycetes bacterium]|nr:hypothetical protein [Planctomycetota bacterium]
MTTPDLQVATDPGSGQVASVRLYGTELLDQVEPCRSELWVNGLPLKLRPHTDPNRPGIEPPVTHLKGERFVDQFCGWGLVLARVMGGRAKTPFNCFGIQTLVRREFADQTCPVPGPGGPVVEAPLWADQLGIMNWNWKFWGEDTRMVFASSHSSGPSDEAGHVGYEHDTPEVCKRFLQNVWRRIYPGCMVIHGGLYYNAKTGHWLAITCRQAQVGYILGLEHAGRGVGYDFTLHGHIGLGESIQLPEVKLYYGRDRAEMMRWLGAYVTHYYQEPPAWVAKVAWKLGVAWNNQPTWREQGAAWIAEVERGECSGFAYSLVTNRPVHSGTAPLGYEPDPNHGPIEEFKAMGRSLAARGIPWLVWMSHAGLLYRGGADIDDDWFIRGCDGRVCASWGSLDQGGLTHINPGHPGYLAYTKKWIRFYIHECGAKGIFFDCLSWAFPPDFRPRSFMRWPGDTNLMALRFMREVHAYIKECDPEAIMLGEGSTLEAPIDIFSVNTNPVRSADGMGPRDFLLNLNQHSPKRLVIDQGPFANPASGFIRVTGRPELRDFDRALTRLARERGGRDAFIHLVGDLSVIDDLLIVSCPEHGNDTPVRLPAPYDVTARLVDTLGGGTVERATDSGFGRMKPGIYRMER